MTVRLHQLFCVCALLFFGAAPAHAKRIALVIGNDNYAQVAKLEKAGNDAEAMARELTAAGFEVRKHRDLTFKQMVVAFEAFFDKIKGGDEVAVFYAGHGVQTDRGSYLLPVDVEGETQSQIEKVSYSVNGLLEELDKIKPQFSLLIVDACRDNPLRSRGRTIGISRGLNAPDLAKGQMVVFSAGKNQRALDSLHDKDTNPNGVFTREFVARMRRPGVSVEALAIEVKNSVEQLARTVNHDQRPLIVNDSTGDFYFFAPTSARAAAPGQSVTAMDPSLREDHFWADTKAPDNIEGYEAYLGTYPGGRYAGLARANISRLRTRSTFATGGSLPPAAPAQMPVAAAPTPVVQSASVAISPASPQGAPGAVAPARPAAAGASSQTSYTLANGDKYEGEVVGALRTGQGKYQFANGDRYEGALVDNTFSGKGVMTFAYGDRFEGEYLRGAKHGQGVYVFANKDRYEGSYANNLFEGRGAFIYANGDRYDGDYARGAKHGHGVYRFANGESYDGNYLDNSYDGRGNYLYASGDRYQGDFKRGIKQGQGIYRFANGDRYEGNFAANVFNGAGKLYLASRDRFEGEFRNNVKDGSGIHYFANGDRYEGMFAAGAQSGSGTHFYANSDKYVGLFQAGVRHGKGTYHFASGQQRELEFANGTEKTN